MSRDIVKMPLSEVKAHFGSNTALPREQRDSCGGCQLRSDSVSFPAAPTGEASAANRATAAINRAL
jgi:hypothetical protein